jgi:DNA-nicking Smr family endonuclease
MARKMSDEERVLWRAVTRAVVPLRRRRVRKDRAQIEHAQAEAAVEGVGSEPAERKSKAAPLRPSAATTRLIPAPPAAVQPVMRLERRLKQRLARGSESIDARIDLHGRTQSQAHAALLRFLQKRQADGAKVVLVITGKGGGAGAGDFAGERGVLKRQVPLWLQLPEFSGYVLAIEQAHIGHGGEGALYVRLRRARTRS